MSATLHDLVVGERGALSELLEETNGELTPEIEQLLTELDLKIDTKLERLGLYYLSQCADAAKVREEEQRLSQRRKTLERGAEGLKAYAERLMRYAGKEKVKSPLVTLAIQKNPPSVKGALDETQLRTLAVVDPPLVVRTPESFTLDKRAVIEWHKAGRFLPAGITVEQGESLRIR